MLPKAHALKFGPQSGAAGRQKSLWDNQDAFKSLEAALEGMVSSLSSPPSSLFSDHKINRFSQLHAPHHCQLAPLTSIKQIPLYITSWIHRERAPAAQDPSMSSQKACLWVQQADAVAEHRFLSLWLLFLFLFFWLFSSLISGSSLNSYSA